METVANDPSPDESSPFTSAQGNSAVGDTRTAPRRWTAIHMSGRHPLLILGAPAVVAMALGNSIFWTPSNELPQLRRKVRALLLLAANSFVEDLRPGRTSIDMAGLQLIARTRNMEPGGKLGHHQGIPPWIGAWIWNSGALVAAVLFPRRALRR